MWGAELRWGSGNVPPQPKTDDHTYVYNSLIYVFLGESDINITPNINTFSVSIISSFQMLRIIDITVIDPRNNYSTSMMCC